MKRRSGKLLDVMPYRHQEWIEEPDGEISITTYQDVTPTIEQNKKEYNIYGDKLTTGKRGDWHKVASIPFNVYEQWKNETNGAIDKDPKLLAKYLNDPDNKFFRTAPTKL
jgi:hypothetical protein